MRNEDAMAIVRAIMTAGTPLGLIPCGLGARDTLRLEAAMPLYGHELDAETSPLEAGLNFAVKLDKADFYRQAGNPGKGRRRSGSAWNCSTAALPASITRFARMEQ